ncbi:MAG: bifunctional hydroxymethylpyrimidine kinase/phosphomethylpyrimidine kinase [Thermodesulfobacteriota bacterium]
MAAPGNPIPRALTIAGSDSGAGAGIQADLKTFAALGVYGTSAITALTAQNTKAVLGVWETPAEFVSLQMEAVLSDIGADAVKTGMLFSAAIISAVREKLRAHKVEKLVVDPVMVAKSGDALLLPEARKALVQMILPLALVVTPNLPEAESLAGFPVTDLSSMRDAARAIADLGPSYVVVKGGHLTGDAVDLLFDGRNFTEIPGPRVETKNTHGTGCTFSAAVCAHLARGPAVPEAVAEAKKFVATAIARGIALGGGHGPTHHMAELYRLAGKGW